LHVLLFSPEDGGNNSIMSGCPNHMAL
jgi:hypothetical protein